MTGVMAPDRLESAERLQRWGRLQRAADLYRIALQEPLGPLERHRALLGLARTMDGLGVSVDALAWCGKAVAELPERASGYATLAPILARSGRLAAAADAAERAHGLDPSRPDHACLVAAIALQDRRPARAQTMAIEALRLAPESQRARFLAATAELSLDGVSPQFDFRRLVRKTRPAAPSGFASSSSFNAALAGAICEQEGLDPAEPGVPLIAGQRLHDIFELDKGLGEALRAMVLAAAAEHPLAAALPDRPAVRGWANVMAAGGYEAPHIHEGAVLSAVYYPRLPGDPQDVGPLVLGPHDLGAAVPAPGPLPIMPSEGLLVLFPSYVYHGTGKFRGGGTRISVAFDILAG